MKVLKCFLSELIIQCSVHAHISHFTSTFGKKINCVKYIKILVLTCVGLRGAEHICFEVVIFHVLTSFVSFDYVVNCKSE